MAINHVLDFVIEGSLKQRTLCNLLQKDQFTMLYFQEFSIVCIFNTRVTHLSSISYNCRASTNLNMILRINIYDIKSHTTREYFYNDNQWNVITHIYHIL